ncbi:type II toxin-antitoxin system VapC family toxin [Methanoculleus sp. UBA413]|jgi:predicted nucleic acid-binding protein|uniref:type II toxin-antitoxin system VapC family toxin n=1 Tax=Methanoculleus sp. UBA413 TaxID=1915509 RepID=UPI00257D180B|nr:PIN domain-containing protein [Methanoculleus sp. UBA413]
MNFSELERGSVFLDTNILLYAYTVTRFSSSCETLLEKVQTKDITGYINSTVVDEFFHKALLTQMYMEKRLSPRQAITYIKKHPDVLTNISTPYVMAKEVLEQYNLIVLDTSDLLSDTLQISQQYGLLFSDALHAASARKHDINYFATNDQDFDRVDFLALVCPSADTTV